MNAPSDSAVAAIADRQRHRRAEPHAPSGAAWQAAVSDCDHLLTIVEQLRGAAPSGAAAEMSAIQVLREDITHREAQVAEREQRVWGWRLVATARDAEVQRELEAIEARESDLQRREASLAQREAAQAEKEAAHAARASALEEEHARNTRTLRDEVARLRSRVLGPGAIDTSGM
uniref:Uncharacterized protein n=1 Tax=Neobodo designis TaxID=312471 RepID=A0A7S1M1E0_NEODS|mmetsp:Transcript_32444/g.100364  ORF Transcript_32444/g.100364 Transcript_32444/m.100364 type:complete len:174 (+) Transcript_32444:55-576(+)